MEYLQYFFNLSHIFSLRPPVMSGRAITILAVIFIALIIFGILSNFKKNKAKSGLVAKAWQNFFYLGFTIGILGFVYLFFASQGVTLLAARFWLLIIGIVAVVWAGFIIKYIKVDLPNKKEARDKKENFQKYIP